MIAIDNEYDKTEAKEFRPYENPPPGGYVLEVIEASDEPARSGKAMVTLSLDIAEGPCAGAFEQYPKKYFQLVNGESLPYFKALIKNFLDSNPEGKTRDLIFTNRDGSKGLDVRRLVGLRIGGNLREAEYTKQDTGEVKVGLEVGYLGAVKDIPNMKVQPLKKLRGAPSGSRPAPTPTPGKPQGQAPQAEDDLPF
jgi:hypothetical protein